MSDRRVILGKVLGYGLLAWAVVLFLTSLPLQFALGPSWPRILAGAGLATIAVLEAVFVARYLRLAPYGWIVAIVVAMSALFAFIGAMELSSALLRRPFPDPTITIPHYIMSAASGLFVLANIVAIFITARADSVRPDIGGSRQRE
ncbi:MAG TPA: hypothetical protein VJK02_23495 [Anaerolineales bacterium]|nr:hypothetical protein [Anaerolineales bacterium]